MKFLGGAPLYFLWLIVFLIPSSCVSVQPVSPETPPIMLDKSYTRQWTGEFDHTILPAGIYRAQFRTQQGVYYLAPASVIQGGYPRRGGLFIPNSGNEKQACWFDDDFVYAPSHRYMLNEPVPFH